MSQQEMNVSPNSPICSVAIAILYQADRYLMQLRDDIPGIVYPGQWALFGGHLEPDETPEFALRRELLEEIDYAIGEFSLLGLYPNPETRVIRHVFHAPLVVSLDTLNLQEGWDFGLVTADEIHQGQRYSDRADRLCPIAKPHQQILLDFMVQR